MNYHIQISEAYSRDQKLFYRIWRLILLEEWNIFSTADIQTALHCVTDNKKITMDYKILKVGFIDKEGLIIKRGNVSWG
jgi:hypothetical protein